MENRKTCPKTRLVILSAREGAAEVLQTDLDAAKSETEALRAQAATAEEEHRQRRTRRTRR